jgi:hypothetical protein
MPTVYLEQLQVHPKASAFLGRVRSGFRAAGVRSL